MKILAFGIAATVLGATAASAVLAAPANTAAPPPEATRWYVGIEGGASWTDISGPMTASSSCGFLLIGCPFGTNAPATSDVDAALIGTIGVDLSGPFRVEAELGYRSGQVTSNHDLSQTTAMLNAFFDLNLTDNLTLSLGAGAGVDFVSWNDLLSDRSQSAFALQGIGGLSLALTDDLDLTLDYRFVGVHEANLDNFPVRIASTTVILRAEDLDTQTVSVGLRFKL